MKINFSDVMMGVILGMMLNSLSNMLGEQRYSEAIRQCIIEKGPNR